MNTFDDLGELFRSVLRDGFGNRLPSQQSMLTALGGMLTYRLASSLSPDIVLYGKPKRVVTTARLAEHGIPLVLLEMGVDFATAVLDDSRGVRFNLGCESEMHAWHYIGPTIEPRHGHLHDFAKLLDFPAPMLLFVGCVSTAYLDPLTRYLQGAAAELSSRWLTKWLGLIVLPSATRQIRQTRIGVGANGGAIEFRPLAG